LGYILAADSAGLSSFEFFVGSERKTHVLRNGVRNGLSRSSWYQSKARMRRMQLPVSYHRLNGSSSPVLTATPHSYGKGQISIPHKINTSERIGMKFGTVDYVLEICPQNKFGDDRSSGGFWVSL